MLFDSGRLPVKAVVEAGVKQSFAGMMELLSAAADLLYPRSCPLCGNESQGSAMHVCWDCLAELKYIRDPYCSCCGDPVAGEVYHRYECSWCRENRPAFAMARSAVRFRGGIKQLLHEFKYSNQVYLMDDLGALLAGCIEAHYGDIDFDAIVSVPLYHSRLRERSYNQSELLAKFVERVSGIPLLPAGMRRRRFTPTQTNLSARERLLNVHSAFEVAKADWVDGRRILLVDDVMTTGATVNECAKELMRVGAVSVHVATVARG
jgi:ComF family protein